MSAKNVTLKIVDVKGEVSIHKFTTGKLDGEPVHITASRGVNYVLSEDETSFAPEDIALERIGEDLLVSFNGSDSADIVIEGYYNSDVGQDNLIIGQHENGQYYSFVPSNGDTSELAYMLPEHVSSTQALGGEAVGLNHSGTGAVAVASSDSNMSSMFANAAAWEGWAFLGATLLGAGVATYLSRSTDKDADAAQNNTGSENGNNDNLTKVNAVFDMITPDTGVGGDLRTKETKLTFSGKVFDLAEGHKVQISLDKGTSWLDATLGEKIDNNGNNWTVDNTGEDIPAGEYIVRVRVVDAEGKAVYAPEDKDRVLVVDTVTPDVTLEIDNSVIKTGKVYELSGKVVFKEGAPKEVSEEALAIEFSIDGKDWHAGWGDQNGNSAKVDKDAKTWTVSLPEDQVPAGTAIDKVQVRVVDHAGNQADPIEHNVLVKENIEVAVTDTAIMLHTHAKSDVVFTLLDEHKDDVLAGYKLTEIKEFVVGNYETNNDADRIQLDTILTGVTKENVAEYIKVESVDNKTTISIDRDGKEGTFAMTELITMDNTTTTLEALIQEGQIAF